MPLGRQKSHIRALDLQSFERFIIRAPSCNVLPTRFEIAWLLWDTFEVPGSAETVELFGDGAATGYQLEYLPTRQFRFTTYGLGGGVVTSSNALVTSGDRHWCLVRAQFNAATFGLRIILNETPTEAGGGMLAPLVTEDRFLCTDDAPGSAALVSLQPAACAVGLGASLDEDEAIYAVVRRAQRLLEPADCLSYVDFARYRPLVAAVPQGHWGDDVTGARIESLVTSTEHLPLWHRADSAVYWSTA